VLQCQSYRITPLQMISNWSFYAIITSVIGGVKETYFNAAVYAIISEYENLGN